MVELLPRLNGELHEPTILVRPKTCVSHVMPLRFAGPPANKADYTEGICKGISFWNIFLLTTPKVVHIVRTVSKRLTGKDVRALRKSLGMTQIELAAYLGVKQGTVSRLETGVRKL